MANTFRLKRSSVQNKVPTTGDLQLGELALNTFDGKLYTKKDNGTASIVEIGGAGAGVSSFSAGSTGLTPSTATTGAVTLAGTLAVANGGTGVTTSTGTGSVVLSSSPSLTTPLLGTPTSGTLTNCTGYTFANLASKPTTLSGYGITDAVPLSGGTMTGDLTMTRHRGVNSLVLNSYGTVNPTSNVYLYSPGNDRDAWIYLDSADTTSNWGIYHRQIDSAVGGLPANSIGFVGGGNNALKAYISLADGSANFVGALSQGGNQVLHAGNYTSYSPSLTGTGASGSWGISITGNAATVSSITSTQVTTGLGYTPNRIDFSRFAGDLNTLGVSNATSGVFNIGTGYTNGPASNLYGTLQAYWNTDIGVQFWQSYNGDSYWRKSVGSTFSGAAWRTYLDSSNYTSYSPSLTGSGASGTWGINISGNAATATAATSAGNITGGNLTGDYQVTSGIGVRFGHANQTDSNDGFISAGRFASGLNIVGTQTTGGTGRQVRIWGSLIDDGGTAYVRNTGTWGISITGSSASCTGNAATATNLSNSGTVTLATATESNAISITQPGYTTDQPVKLLNFDWYGNLFSLGNIRSGSTPTNGFGVYYTASGGSRTEIARFGTGGSFNAVGAITQNGSQVLHAGNYTSYSPSLTGSGASGTWGISITGNAATSTTATNQSGGTINATTGTVTPNTSGVSTGFNVVNGDITTYRSGGTTGVIYFGTSGSRYLYYDGTNYNMPNGQLYLNGSITLHAGNYTSYAPSLTGSGASGTWGINVTGSSASCTGNAATATTASNVSATSDQAIVNQDNGGFTQWRGRILSKNSVTDRAAFLGNYGTICGVFAHNNALTAWADLYVNTVDGNSGGTVRMPGGTYISNNIALHAGNYNSYAPTLTGTGASGTWGINITGNAATATTASTANAVTFANVTSKPTTLSGYGITDAQSAPVVSTVTLSGQLQVTFTGLPTSVRNIRLVFHQLIKSGTLPFGVLLGNTDGTYPVTTWNSTSTRITTANNTGGSNSTTDFTVYMTTAAMVFSGHMDITRLGTDTAGPRWTSSHLGKMLTTNTIVGGGDFTGGAAFTADRVRVRCGGSETFTSGTITLIYW